MRFFIQCCMFIFLLYYGQFSAFSQSMKYADSLYLSGNYYEAAIEYERVVFLARDAQLTSQALMKKTQCQKQQFQFDDAYKTLIRIPVSAQSESFIRRVDYEKALCCYLAHRPVDALQILHRLNGEAEDTALLIKSYLVQILAYSEIREWDEARRICVQQWIPLLSRDKSEVDSLQHVCNALFEESNRPELLDIEKARRRALLCPGLGLIYAGKTGEGLLNVAIQASLIYLGIVQWQQQFYLSAYFFGVSLWHRFYLGGARRAIYQCEKQNAEMLKKFETKVKKTLLQINSWK